MVWNPEHYVHGNYFQKEVSEVFRKSLNVTLSGTILDVGSGDGSYSNTLAKSLKGGHILGIDSSEDMVRHANQHWARKNLSFEVHRIEEFQQPMTFDFVLSFWCLHWTDINLSFPNIFHALKNGGRLYALLSSFSDNSILQTWRELAKQNRYTDLTDEYLNTDDHKEYFYNVVHVLTQLPFKQIKIDLKTTRTYLPHIDYFRNLLRTLPFTFPEDLMDEFIKDMVVAFQNICQRKYGGKLYYETRPIFIEAIK